MTYKTKQRKLKIEQKEKRTNNNLQNITEKTKN